MIDPEQLRQYLQLKRRLAAAVENPDVSGFEPSRRGFSEGLAKPFDLDGEAWTYATDGKGYRFSNAKRRFSVFVLADGSDREAFTSAELVGWLSAFTRHQNINQMVIDLWLVKAAGNGLVEDHPSVRGGFRLR
jgi:hypothetical protein